MAKGIWLPLLGAGIGMLALLPACQSSGTPTPPVSGGSGGGGGAGGGQPPPGMDAGATGGAAPDAATGSGGAPAPIDAATDVAGEAAGDVPLVPPDAAVTTLPPGVPATYRLLLDQPFTSAASLAAVQAGNPSDWTHGADDGGYLQFGGVGYTPPNPPIPESFTSFALVPAMKFGSFVLEVELAQRNPDQTIPQRDLCIVFGIGSETTYYYAHIAQGHTDRWHNIHIINNAPRRPITKTDNGGIKWGLNQWHKFRLVRDVDSGAIAVYMDGELTAPILTASDTTFRDGYVGFATHQDSGRVRNLKVWGAASDPTPAPATFFR